MGLHDDDCADEREPRRGGLACIVCRRTKDAMLYEGVIICKRCREDRFASAEAYRRAAR